MPLTRSELRDASSTDSDLETADLAAGQALGAHRDHPAVRALGVASEIADQLPSVVLCSAVLAAGLVGRQERVARAGGRMLLSVLVAAALKAAVKNTVSRSRPNLLIDEGVHDVVPLGPERGDWHSFPSGHTAGAVAMARGAARSLPGIALPAYAVAAAIGAIQVPRAKHYPSDVIAGIGVGIAAEFLVEGAIRLVATASESADPAEARRTSPDGRPRPPRRQGRSRPSRPASGCAPD